MLGNMIQLCVCQSLHVRSEVALTLQTRLQLQQLLRNEARSESRALLKLMLNEKLCHVQITSFMALSMFLQKMPAMILSAIAMTLS